MRLTFAETEREINVRIDCTGKDETQTRKKRAKKKKQTKKKKKNKADNIRQLFED
jgi:hypothetical protein